MDNTRLFCWIVTFSMDLKQSQPIDKYDPIAIYFIVWGSGLYTLFFVSCLENIL